MAEITYLTAEGLEKLKKEVHELRTKGRAEIARAIQEARDKGDLSENAEYHAAKEAQGFLEMKIADQDGELQFTGFTVQYTNDLVVIGTDIFNIGF